MRAAAKNTLQKNQQINVHSDHAYTEAQLETISVQLFKANDHRWRSVFLLMHWTAMRGEELRYMRLSYFQTPRLAHMLGPAEVWVQAFTQVGGKGVRVDKVTSRHIIKNMNPDLCPVSALGEHLALKFAPGAIEFPVPTLEDPGEWCSTFLFPGATADKPMTYAAHARNHRKALNAAGVVSGKSTQINRLSFVVHAEWAGLSDDAVRVIIGCDDETVLKGRYQSGVSIPGLQFAAGADPKMSSRLSMWAAHWEVPFRKEYPHLIRQLFPFLERMEDVFNDDPVRVRQDLPSLVAAIAFLEHVGEAVLQKGLARLHLYGGAEIYQLPVFLSSEYQELQRNFQTQLAAAQPRAALAAQHSAAVAPIVAQQLRSPLLVHDFVSTTSHVEQSAANQPLTTAGRPLTFQRLTDLQSLYHQREEQTVLNMMPWQQQKLQQQQQQVQALQQQVQALQQQLQHQQHIPPTMQQQQYTVQNLRQQQHTGLTVQQQQQQHMLQTVPQQQYTAQNVQQQQQHMQQMQQMQHTPQIVQKQQCILPVAPPPPLQPQHDGQPEGAAASKSACKKRAQKDMFLRNGPGQTLTILKVAIEWWGDADGKALSWPFPRRDMTEAEKILDHSFYLRTRKPIIHSLKAKLAAKHFDVEHPSFVQLQEVAADLQAWLDSKLHNSLQLTVVCKLLLESPKAPKKRSRG